MDSSVSGNAFNRIDYRKERRSVHQDSVDLYDIYTPQDLTRLKVKITLDKTLYSLGTNTL